VEIAFGTRSGVVRVIVQHPENVGQGLQVFRTFVAHTSPVIKVVLGEKHLITGNTSITAAVSLLGFTVSLYNWYSKFLTLYYKAL